jgi:hypothetical protein
MTDFVPIEIPPGVVVRPTKHMRSSNWAETNMMRWVEGELQPVGGQARYGYAFASRCKMIHGWYDLAGGFHVAYVCEQNVYVDTAGVLTEITPAGGWSGPSVPTTGGYGDLLYGADNYGTPRSSGTILPQDKIPDMWSVDNFGALLLVMSSIDGRLLQWNPVATADVNDVQTLSLIGAPTGGTFALNFNGQISGPLNFNATAANVQTALAAMPNIGAGNIVCSGGPLPGNVVITFQGALAAAPQPTFTGANNALTGGVTPAPSIGHTTVGTGLLLTRVGGSPHGRCFVVTQEKFVMVFGQSGDGTVDGGSARRFGWCDQENMTDWNFLSVISQAGFLDIEPASPIVTAQAGKFGVLMFTAQKAYIVGYRGLPYVYGYLELADECTPWSPASIVSTSYLMMWMGQQGAWTYDGTTISAVACLVRPWITDDIDPVNVRTQACAVNVGDFNEFWWFFPQNGQPYNTRAAIYNYKEGWWSQANIARSAGITSSYAIQPIMANGTKVYQHELGAVYGDADPPYAETFELNLTTGKRLVTMMQMLPDIKGDAQNVLYSIFYRNQRMTGFGDQGAWTPPEPPRPDGYVDLRVTGRDLRLRLSTASAIIQPFTVGQHLVDFAIRGDR